MKTFVIILASLVILALAYALVVLIPVALGKLLFRWSGARCGYILKESFSSILSSLVISLILTGIILLIGLVFHQQWAFSGGLLFVYLFWVAIKTVRENIKNSKNL